MGMIVNARAFGANYSNKDIARIGVQQHLGIRLLQLRVWIMLV